MKNIKLLLGILVIMVFAGNVNLDAQKGMKRMKSDSTSMKCDSACMRMWRHMPMSMNHDSSNMGMRHGRNFDAGMRNYSGMRGHGGMMKSGDMRHMNQRQQMMARDWRGPDDRMAMDNRMRISNIPDLTAKQKEDIAKIREENRLQMQKLREKQQKEITEARDAQKKKVMNVLTEEQKKSLTNDKSQK